MKWVVLSQNDCRHILILFSIFYFFFNVVWGFPYLASASYCRKGRFDLCARNPMVASSLSSSLGDLSSSGPKPFRQAGISTRLALLLPCRVQRDRHCVAAALPSRCRYSRQARFPLLRSLVLSRKDNFGRLRDRAVFVVFNHFFVFFFIQVLFSKEIRNFNTVLGPPISRTQASFYLFLKYKDKEGWVQ